MNPMLTIAVRAAREAGRIITRNFNRIDRLTISDKGSNDFVSEVDRNAEAVIINLLREKYPHHAILAEESGKQGADDYIWIIDPLDGTTNFLHGFPQFAVSIALKIKGRLEVGVVYDPVSEEMYTACRGEGALLNDKKIRVSGRKGLNGALLGTGLPYRDFRFTDNYMGMLKALIKDSAGVRRPGSAALDFAYVAAGRMDGFWELGLREWDFAAGALLVREAGGLVTDIGGGERYLETGNVIAGNIKVHNAMLKCILPHLDSKLTA
ncbi:MAG: inositol monophosphatase family protein [Candidatus Thiodiazotropha endolucinida]|uniref:Inositol-1-monophosphatase n=2 Tax=Candidatus Thiodiazotropha TaxID=1913444 RepID=A0A7Z0VPR6_9GAMM|nr:inositol monophosphatase family protein [Candidatus Thiodiazotropha endolucinida]MBT3012369.1 inositol-1-monophosphatase [Candidatus Thiodiazotropha sp. (ex Lucina pensylvanica)]MBT3017266.1 inositol-1-monophosphatase [Candidatus Thiodiazotropha taylori]MBT3038778.1 inositol-1-monophosphatase [Candidatus Thiodiazotropha sp. (ex Codakia orbicularis)]MBV2102752.1 inositol-1-monophosphatase [Candidatus Thiodiazotropha sp. (ex Lucina aurantia)]MBT3022918.1 inositol-1-monophosphatase [Candidatus